MKKLNDSQNCSFSNKTYNFYSSNESKFAEKISLKIHYLKNLKDQILIETKKSIEILEQGTLSLISLINVNIKKLLDLKTDSISCKIEEKKFSINKFNLSDINKVLKDKFSDSISNLIHFKDKEFTKSKFLKYHNGEFKCGAISNDENFLITGGYDTSIRIWDLKSKQQVTCLLYHKSNVTCLDITKNDYFLVSGSFDKTLALWDLNKRELIRIYRGHSDAICAVSISYDSSYIVSCSDNNEIIVWDFQYGKSLNRVVLNYFIWSAFVTSKLLLYVGVASSLEIWSLIDFKHSKTLKHDDDIITFAISKNEELLITSSYYSISIWNNTSMLLKSKFESPKPSIDLISITPDHNHLITSHCDNSLILWSMHSQTILHEFQIHSDLIKSIFSLNNLIISISIDKKIGLSKIPKKSFKCYLQLKPYNYESLALKNQIAIYGDNKNVSVLNFKDNFKYTALEGHSDQISKICISDKMNFIVSSSSGTEKNLILWDFKKLEMINYLEGQTSSICIDLSNDEKFCISADHNGKILVFDLASQIVYCEFNQNCSCIYGVKFCNDGRFVASGGQDKVLRLWDVGNKVLYAALDGHLDAITKILVTSDDKYIVTASWKDGVKIWDFDNLKLYKNVKGFKELEDWKEYNEEVQDELIQYLV